ncbi:TetR/AcrR family transcriptional regulator [Bacillus tuaregi]|uniref:TetR/AcrR family transcriptional regulator n=1 Tax=Bacillus tuaregi TaxID=1816695 RepID=UPI0008F90489|nr:TetR/AcrR family transcriptional regulator [Bacillus tuaregi]
MSPRKPTSQELTKELILEKARLQFVEKGFQRVSMRSIAQLLGCSHGAIYYHFKNKAELFYAVVEEDFSKLKRRLEETIEGPEDDTTKLYSVLLSYIEFGLNHQSQYELMFLIRNSEVDSLSQASASQSYQRFAETVQSLSDKKLKIVDVWSAFLALHGFVSHYRGYVESFEEARLAAQAHVNFIIKGLKG